MQFYWILHFLNFYPPLCYVTWHSAKNFSKANCVCVRMEQLFASLDRLNIVLLNLLQVRNNKKVGSFLRWWLEIFPGIAGVFPRKILQLQKKKCDNKLDWYNNIVNSGGPNRIYRIPKLRFGTYFEKITIKKENTDQQQWGNHHVYLLWDSVRYFFGSVRILNIQYLPTSVDHWL